MRFYSFALPHWGWILVAVTAMVLTSLLWGSFIFLVKPLMKSTLQAHEVALRQSPSGSPVEGGVQRTAGPAAPGGAARPVDTGGILDVEGRVEHWAKNLRAVQWFTNLRAVRKVRGLVQPGPDTLKKIAVLVATCIAPLLFLAYFFGSYAQQRVSWQVMAEVRMALFERLVGRSLTFFSRQRAGDLLSRLTNDIATTRAAVKILFGDLLLNPMKIVIFLALALWYSWQLTLVVLVGLPLFVGILRRYGGRIRRYSRRNLEKLGDVTDAISQLFSGVRVVKSFGMEQEENAEFRRTNKAQLKRAFKLVRSRAWADALPEAVICFGTAGVLLVADRLIGSGRLPAEDLWPCALAITCLANPTKRMVRCYNVLQESLGAVGRLFEMMDVDSDIQEAPDAKDLGEVREGIRFRNVWFSYDREPVLKGVDLFIPRGKVYAIVGETGAGKSTLLDLIPRFYDATEGSVEIDNVDVRTVTLKSLVRKIAIVGQHPFLFNRTMAKNIRYGKRDATDEEVKDAAKVANIHEFIESLPDGYETMVGERGDALSGGQRQCITLARAVLKDAPILILDEATSNLDSESELAVQNALARLMVGRTTLVIAHRLATVRHADKIIVLKDGQVVEQGSHDELLDKGGEYEKLYRIQFAGPQPQADAGSGPA